jgi:hypothetical protein
MPLGDKAWEEKGAAIGASVKSVDANGITFEYTVATEVKGLGRFASGRNVGTISIVQGPATNISKGQGVCTMTDGELLPWHFLGIGKVVGNRVKGAGLVVFSTRSQKYAWVNDNLYCIDFDNAMDLSEISDTGYEWK